MLRALPLALLVASAAMHGQAQSPIQSSYQSWMSATVQGDATQDVRLHFDATARFYDDFSPAQTELRPGIGLRIADGMHLWAGYVWVAFWNGEHAFGDEHRAWEQWSWSLPPVETISVFLRVRLEERWRPQTSSDVGLRLRLMARMLVPFAAQSPLHLSLWDEGYVGLDEAGRDGAVWQHTGFIENQLFLGVGCNVDRHRFELGYLSHWLGGGSTTTVHHVLALNASFTID